MKKFTEKEKNFYRNYQQMKRGHGIKYRFLFDEKDVYNIHNELMDLE